MIELTRLNGDKFYLNPHQIEMIEKTPDTIVSLASGRKMVVKDPVEMMTEKIIQYRRKLGVVAQEM